jgi:hypothetical protein
VNSYFSEKMFLERVTGSNVIFSCCSSLQTGFYRKLSQSTESMSEVVEPGEFMPVAGEL